MASASTSYCNLRRSISFTTTPYCARAGWPAVEQAINRCDLPRASEVFLTSSLIGVQALVSVDGYPLPDAAPVATPLATADNALANED